MYACIERYVIRRHAKIRHYLGALNREARKTRAQNSVFGNLAWLAQPSKLVADGSDLEMALILM